MPAKDPGSSDRAIALEAYIKLMRAAESVTARLNPGLVAQNLSISQFGALEALLHLGPLCQKDLGEKLLKTSGNVTMVVDNLEKRGLVRRERSATDRRFVAVHLTEAGRSLITGMWPAHAEAIGAEMGVLTPDELRELSRLCRKLGRRD